MYRGGEVVGGSVVGGMSWMGEGGRKWGVGERGGEGSVEGAWGLGSVEGGEDRRWEGGIVGEEGLEAVGAGFRTVNGEGARICRMGLCGVGL